jgi:urease accessory protein
MIVAHLVTTGLGPIYDGISHLLLSPDDLIPVLAVGALAGLNGAAAGRHGLFAVTIAWLCGGVAGSVVGRPLIPEAAPAVSFLVLGVLIAADRRLATSAVTALAGLLGAVHGWLNGASIAAAGQEGLGMLGIAGAVFVLVALVAGAVVSIRPAGGRLAVRVAGSWVAAIGLLLLGWSLRRA